jgi:hypothetical protein
MERDLWDDRTRWFIQVLEDIKKRGQSWQKNKKQNCSKREENGDCSNNTYKIQLLLEDEEKCAIHTFTVF